MYDTCCNGQRILVSSSHITADGDSFERWNIEKTDRASSLVPLTPKGKWEGCTLALPAPSLPTSNKYTEIMRRVPLKYVAGVQTDPVTFPKCTCPYCHRYLKMHGHEVREKAAFEAQFQAREEIQRTSG